MAPIPEGTKRSTFLSVLLFSLPLALTGILQILFNTADMIIVGRFAGSSALAAVGATSSLVHLLVGTFVGTSVGANIHAARCLGANDLEKLRRGVSTAVILSALIGIFVMLLGQTAARGILVRMGTPADILEDAAGYLRIYFWGAPALLIYNFSAALLRANGDTRHSLYFLVIAGVLNVTLNLLFVTVAKLGVAGVAYATVIAQHVSLALILRFLVTTPSPLRLSAAAFRFHPKEALEILRYGFPAGLQAAVIDLANVTVQSAANSFGTVVVAANAASASICGFVYTAMNSVYHASITFSSRAVGSGEYRKLPSILAACLLSVLAISLPLITVGTTLSREFLSIYVSKTDPAYEAVIAQGVIRAYYCLVPYFICGFMEVFCGMVRGMGCAWLPVLVSMLGCCGIRLAWIYTVFQAVHTPVMLYLVFPVSWVFTVLMHMTCFIILYRRQTLAGEKPLHFAREAV